LAGDPYWSPHPVVAMGMMIKYIHGLIKSTTNNSPLILKLGGLGLTIIVVFLSGFAGFIIERISLEISSQQGKLYGIFLLSIPLASSLAGGSLKDGVNNVIKHIDSSKDDYERLIHAREKLKLIVGRDVNGLNQDEILRATAETASENAIDGIFAPLFWMIIGASMWKISNALPGPLAMAWGFKASSTIDSMLGYKTGNLKWIGFSGAKLDDLLTWIPCRLVLLTLPLISGKLISYFRVINIANIEGSKYISPNAGRSQAIFSQCIGIKMGGTNSYNGIKEMKPIIGNSFPKPNIGSVERIISLSYKLEILWLILMLLLFNLN
tara:strand:+ start:584 stop:1552 length:969 start_codon:yes stop_codon:yes gene_type:complete